MTRRFLALALVFLAADSSAQAPKGEMQLALTGISTFKGTVTAGCFNDQPGVITIEGKSTDYFLRFSIYEPRKGTHKIVMEGLTPATPSYARFDVLRIKKEQYVIPAGDVTAEDNAGRAGTLRAKRFTRSGGGPGSIDLTLEARWVCK
jgi:hypothetical protein